MLNAHKNMTMNFDFIFHLIAMFLHKFLSGNYYP